MSSKLSPNIVDDTGDAKAFRDITNKMCNTFEVKTTTTEIAFIKSSKSVA